MYSVFNQENGKTISKTNSPPKDVTHSALPQNKVYPVHLLNTHHGLERGWGPRYYSKFSSSISFCYEMLLSFCVLYFLVVTASILVVHFF